MFSSRRRHTRLQGDWSSDVCSSDLLKRSYQESALTDTVDVVVVGYYYGRGARAAWGIGSLLCAVYDKDTDTFPTVTRCASRSEERRVGKECRSRWSPDH